MMGLKVETYRTKFYDHVCNECQSFTRCSKDKQTIVGCATLIIWNKLESK